MTAGQIGETRQYLVQEESQPDAFSLAVFADQVHAVIPIASSDQGKAVFASLETGHDRLNTVVVQSAGHLRSHRQIVIRIFFRFYGAAFDKTGSFVQHSGIASGE